MAFPGIFFMFFSLYKALMLNLPAQTWWVIPAQWGMHGLRLKHDFKIALMMRKAKHKLWSELLSISTLCVKVGDVSEYQRTSVLVSPKHKIKIYRRYARNDCQPKSRIHSQLVGNAKPNSFKSYLNLAFCEGWISVTGLLLLSVVGHNSWGCSFTRTLLVYSILKFIGLWLFIRQQQVIAWNTCFHCPHL